MVTPCTPRSDARPILPAPSLPATGLRSRTPFELKSWKTIPVITPEAASPVGERTPKLKTLRAARKAINKIAGIISEVFVVSLRFDLIDGVIQNSPLYKD